MEHSGDSLDINIPLARRQLFLSSVSIVCDLRDFVHSDGLGIQQS